LILLDIAMPGINGLSGLDQLQSICPASKIAALSALDDPSIVKQTYAMGMNGFISKSLEAETLQQAINKVLAGESFFPTFLHGTKMSPKQQAHLTTRQLEVLALMAQGHTNKVIARELGLSENTIRVHVAAVLKNLGSNTRMEAVFAARMQSIVT
jgi:DNA-binding NarL/FixJ family response regulator